MEGGCGLYQPVFGLDLATIKTYSESNHKHSLTLKPEKGRHKMPHDYQDRRQGYTVTSGPRKA